MTDLKKPTQPANPLPVNYKLGQNFPVFFSVFAICVLMHLTLALSSRLFPQVDLPFHLAMATVYKFYGSPANDFSQFYELQVFLTPNTFFLFFTSLDVFPSVEVGNKVFYALYLLLFPVSVLLLIRRLDGNPWYALFSFLLIYNFNLHWGFVNFYFAIPLVLLMFYFILRSLQTESAKDKAAVTGLLLLIYFTHALATIFALIVFAVIYGLSYRRSTIKLVSAGLMALPVLALVAFWWGTSQSGADTVGFLIDYYTQEYLPGLKKRAKLIALENYSLYPGIWGWIAGAFFTMLMHLPLAWWVLVHHRGLARRGQWERNARLYLFILVAVGVFFLAPTHIPGMHILYERFSVFVHVGLIILASVLVGRQYHRQVLALAGVAFLLHFGAYTERQMAFEKETADFRPDFLPAAVKGKRFAGLMLDDSFRGRIVYGHFPNYQIIWHQGVTPSKALDFRFNSLRRKPGGAKVPKYQNKFTSSGRSPAHPYGQFADYIFVRGKVREKAIKARLGDFKLVRTSGKWSLWEKN